MVTGDAGPPRVRTIFTFGLDRTAHNIFKYRNA
jgi:hypothetical protein